MYFMGGWDLAVAVEGGKVRGGNSRVWGEGVTRAELQKERQRADSVIATTDINTR